MTNHLNQIGRTNIVLIAAGAIVLSIASFANIIFEFDILVMIAWLFFCCTIFIYNLHFALKYIHYFFFLTLNLIGVYIIDNNDLYLSELRIRSSDYNALLPVFLIHFVFILFLLLFDKHVISYSGNDDSKIKIYYNNRDIMNMILTSLGWVLAAMTLYLFIKAISKPAFIMGYDRFEYSRAYINGIWEKVNKYISWLLPIIPLLLINNKKKLGWGILLLYAVYSFMIGNKFGTFLSLIIMLIPYLYMRFKLQNITKKTVIGVLFFIVVFGCVLVLVLFVFHKLTYNYTVDDFKIYLYQRIAQQGQIWWAVYGKCKDSVLHINEISDEIIGFWGIDTSSPHEMNFGIYKMMQYVTPYETYVSKILAGSRYTTSTCASIYYYTKLWGFIVLVPFSACILSYFINWYWRALYSNEIIGVIISWVMIGRLATIYTMSEFQMIFNIKYLIILIVAVCIDRYLSFKSKKKLTTGMV